MTDKDQMAETSDLIETIHLATLCGRYEGAITILQKVYDGLPSSVVGEGHFEYATLRGGIFSALLAAGWQR
jgi:hypothetical protein